MTNKPENLLDIDDMAETNVRSMSVSISFDFSLSLFMAVPHLPLVFLFYIVLLSSPY